MSNIEIRIIGVAESADDLRVRHREIYGLLNRVLLEGGELFKPSWRQALFADGFAHWVHEKVEVVFKDAAGESHAVALRRFQYKRSPIFVQCPDVGLNFQVDAYGGYSQMLTQEHMDFCDKLVTSAKKQLDFREGFTA